MEAADDEVVHGLMDALTRFDLVIEDDDPARFDLTVAVGSHKIC
jgi:hypothetical protein